MPTPARAEARAPSCTVRESTSAAAQRQSGFAPHTRGEGDGCTPCVRVRVGLCYSLPQTPNRCRTPVGTGPVGSGGVMPGGAQSASTGRWSRRWEAMCAQTAGGAVQRIGGRWRAWGGEGEDGADRVLSLLQVGATGAVR